MRVFRRLYEGFCQKIELWQAQKEAVADAEGIMRIERRIKQAESPTEAQARINLEELGDDRALPTWLKDSGLGKTQKDDQEWDDDDDEGGLPTGAMRRR